MPLLMVRVRGESEADTAGELGEQWERRRGVDMTGRSEGGGKKQGEEGEVERALRGKHKQHTRAGRCTQELEVEAMQTGVETAGRGSAKELSHESTTNTHTYTKIYTNTYKYTTKGRGRGRRGRITLTHYSEGHN